MTAAVKCQAAFEILLNRRIHLTLCSFPFSLYNHIQLSSNLMSGCDYSLFKVRWIDVKCEELEFVSFETTDKILSIPRNTEGFTRPPIEVEVSLMRHYVVPKPTQNRH